VTSYGFSLVEIPAKAGSHFYPCSNGMFRLPSLINGSPCFDEFYAGPFPALPASIDARGAIGNPPGKNGCVIFGCKHLQKMAK